MKKIKPNLVLLLCIVLLAGLITGVVYFTRPAPVAVISKAPTAAKPKPVLTQANTDYIGSDTCKHCHQPEFKAWQGSHHALAMQEANAQTVLGNFENATFKYFDVESTFFKHDGKFMVRTDGPDGKQTDYTIAYTFGVTPLQQYLIAFPGGRYQALGIAWDSRPKSEGGQRWFHLYLNEKIDHSDPLHWTGRYQNWNMHCAECHSTNLKKGYDAASDSYHTTFNEINVACESCHGPASRHIDWAKQAQPPYSDHDKGLAVKLKSQWQNAWTFPDAKAKFAHREQRADESLMNVCWSCHARRSTLLANSLPGLALEDTHNPAFLTQPVYYADGQQRDEDFTWGSFRQSKMFQKGVTCMDCHEPHGLKLRAEGNALCTRCHNAAKFDTKNHHFHKPGSNGAQCINCHAPEQNYMVIDGRHDHSFRLPRPDLSISLGSPNACTQCHQRRKAEWAAATLDRWLGKAWRNRAHYGTILHAGVNQGIKALPALIDLAGDSASPAIVRATALTLISPLMQQESVPKLQSRLQDADPSVRIAALDLFESIDPVNRALYASPLLADPICGVRIAAARLLADIPDSEIPANHRNARSSAMKELLESMNINADWPVEGVNRGNLALRQGDIEAAIAAYKHALVLDPHFVEAYINLADAYRQQNRDDDGEIELRKGLSLLPDAADLHHALGLLLVRKTDPTAALQALAKAAKLAPENARYAYVYGIALNSLGKQREALTLLKAADTRHPYNLDILSALISMQREAGNNKAALAYARKIAEVMPDNPDIKRLIAELESGR